MLAAAVALGVAELVSALIEGTDNPVVSVGEVVVDHVPSWVKDWAISVFGTTDKVALIIGTLVLLVFAAAGLGILAARRRWVGDVGIAAFALVGVAAAVTRPDGDWVDALPRWRGPPPRPGRCDGCSTSPRPQRTGRASPRRPWRDPTGGQFLLAGVATGSAAVIAGGLGRALRGRFQVDAAARAGDRAAAAPSTAVAGGQ